MSKKIIILARVSTAPQDISSQTNDLIQEAIRLGYPTDNQIIIETVESGTKKSEEERLGLTEMKLNIEADSNIDCVICWEPSRLARRQKVLYSIRDYLAEKKIQLYILHPPVKLLTDDRSQIDANSNLHFSIFATLAENEMMIKKERFQREKTKLRMENKKFAGAVIFGYIKNAEKKCVPHPIYSKIIIDLFNHYISTDSSLYETYKYASGKWADLFPVVEYKKAQRKIKHFFNTEIYANGNWCYPPIIAKDVWEKTQEKMSKARCQPRYNCKREFLCRGKMFCGYCGRMMTGCGGNVRAYVCSTNKLHSLQINQKVADWIMWEETRCIVNWNNAYNAPNDRTNEVQEKLNEKLILKKQYEDVLKQYKEQEEKILDSYLNNQISKELYDKKIGDIKEKINKYTNMIYRVDAEISSYQTMIDDMRNHWEDKSIKVDKINDFTTKQELVRKYIHKMIIKRYDERPHTLHISFEYAMPLMARTSEYLYTFHNQNKMIVSRINNDGTIDEDIMMD